MKWQVKSLLVLASPILVRFFQQGQMGPPLMSLPGSALSGPPTHVLEGGASPSNLLPRVSAHHRLLINDREKQVETLRLSPLSSAGGPLGFPCVARERWYPFGTLSRGWAESGSVPLAMFVAALGPVFVVGHDSSRRVPACLLSSIPRCRSQGVEG